MIFSYECQKCHEKFDLLVGVTMEKTSFECPECHSKDIVKLITSSVVKVKGSSSGNSSCSTGSCPF